MRRNTLHFGLTTLLATSLVACGDDDTNQNSDASGETSSDTNADADADATDTENTDDASSGDGDGDDSSSGDGDDSSTGDGDGDSSTGDGDSSTGDGDGDSSTGDGDGDGDGDGEARQRLARLATVPLGAEITGLFVSDEGDLFFNVQHPSDANTVTDSDTDNLPFDKGSVGVVRDLDISGLALDFRGVDVPADDAKQLVAVAGGTYQVLGREGDTFDGDIANGLGVMMNPAGDTVVKASNDPDFNAYVSTGAGEGYFFSNWEDRPGGMSRLEITKGSDGSWTVDSALMVDFSAVEGTWVNCFGSLSPWDTPLTSEESFATFDTEDWNNPMWQYIGGIEDLASHLGFYPNPYRYGYIVEITDPNGNPTPEKRMAMGRFSHENSIVMPDERTVYLSDDGTGTVLFKFVAATAGDLSSGTLYAAQITQDAGSSDAATTGFDITWIELGTATDAMVEGWVAQYDGIDQSDYTGSDTDDQDAGTFTSYITPADVAAWNAGTAADDRVAFLMSREAAIAKGATAEWRKMEGVFMNAARAEEAVEGTDTVAGEDVSEAFLYIAMSNINRTMTDDEGAIQLTNGDGDCGGVYQASIGANYNITRIEPAILGGPFDESAGANTCATDNVSEPDNVWVLDDGRVLIGEDTGEHENNMLWVFDPKAK